MTKTYRDRSTDQAYLVPAVGERRLTVEMPEPYLSLLREDAAAWEFYEKQPASYRKAVNWWVASAKKEETRSRRLDSLAAYSARGERVPQFTWKKSAE